jgi:valyl-tRNA synthetase
MELSKNFDFNSAEKKWYQHWLDKKYFNSKPDHRKAFTVVIPPPNVTGVLHMGHTLNETVQDILVRRARMSGFNACWVPGSDHASIATEAKVVQMLKEKDIDKNNLSREEFLKYAFEWKEKYGNIIYNQIARLGCSVDWERVSFTMDDHYYKAVIKVFVDLYKKGLIYRGARMINWDPSAKTALSDEEVEYKDVVGKLYYVKYYVVNSESSVVNKPTHDSSLTTHDYIIIATQRPETIMGDTAVCVNPNDDRYKNFAGKKLMVPLVNREVPVIFDEYVDPGFGTGALKITPAHDINDYNIGLKHNLEIINTLNDDGTLSEAAKVFVGMDRFTARKKAVEQLKAEGLLVKEEEYTTRLGYSQRTNAVVEPRISTQWFVKMKELAQPALQPVVDGEIKFYPEGKFSATYKYWLENVKDWCISRQLWWGQQIPAWYDEAGNVFVAETKEEALLESATGSQLTSHDSRLTQDPDVLDTWFSSWLWPMEVFKGITEPNNADFNYYYPTNTLVTAPEIMFFWVARMIMAGVEYTGKIPFSSVYYTGIVRDNLGRKMSKSLGNSPDLLELIDKYGADAVRFGIMVSSPAGNDILFDEAALEQGRNFNNKLWNALKLVKMWSEKTQETSDKIENDFAITWFENKLNETKLEVDNLLKQFKLSEALKTIYSLIWDDFCSWYLEWVKPNFGEGIEKNIYEKTVFFFEELVQLLHPFMPFITEDIYHLLKERNDGDDLCIKQISITAKENVTKEILEKGDKLKSAIKAVKTTKLESNLKKSDSTPIKIKTPDESEYKTLLPILTQQTGSRFEGFVNEPPPSFYIYGIIDSSVIYGSNSGGAELAIKGNDDKRKKLLEDLSHQKGFLQSVLKKLSNEKFVQNAKPEVIELERKKQADAEARIKTIEESLSNL